MENVVDYRLSFDDKKNGFSCISQVSLYVCQCKWCMIWAEPLKFVGDRLSFDR